MEVTKETLVDNYTKILTIMLPIIPHMASECLTEVANTKKFNWPTIDLELLQSKKSNIVIQINAKKRAVIEIENGISEENLLLQIKEMKNVQKFLEGKMIIKTIFIKDKLINIIIK